jgi:hypothetical protein
MLIREYHEKDLDALKTIHGAQGFDYALPDLRNPLFVSKLVLQVIPNRDPRKPAREPALHKEKFLARRCCV